jgi:hypothetical protein
MGPFRFSVVTGNSFYGCARLSSAVFFSSNIFTINTVIHYNFFSLLPGKL